LNLFLQTQNFSGQDFWFYNTLLKSYDHELKSFNSHLQFTKFSKDKSISFSLVKTTVGIAVERTCHIFFVSQQNDSIYTKYLLF